MQIKHEVKYENISDDEEEDSIICAQRASGVGVGVDAAVEMNDIEILLRPEGAEQKFIVIDTAHAQSTTNLNKNIRDDADLLHVFKERLQYISADEMDKFFNIVQRLTLKNIFISKSTSNVDAAPSTSAHNTNITPQTMPGTSMSCSQRDCTVLNFAATTRNVSNSVCDDNDYWIGVSALWFGEPVLNQLIQKIEKRTIHIEEIKKMIQIVQWHNAKTVFSIEKLKITINQTNNLLNTYSNA